MLQVSAHVDHEQSLLMHLDDQVESFQVLGLLRTEEGRNLGLLGPIGRVQEISLQVESVCLSCVIGLRVDVGTPGNGGVMEELAFRSSVFYFAGKTLKQFVSSCCSLAINALFVEEVGVGSSAVCESIDCRSCRLALFNGRLFKGE